MTIDHYCRSSVNIPHLLCMKKNAQFNIKHDCSCFDMRWVNYCVITLQNVAEIYFQFAIIHRATFGHILLLKKTDDQSAFAIDIFKYQNINRSFISYLFLFVPM